MARRSKKQSKKRKPVMLDERTHADLSSYADSLERGVKFVVTDLIYSNPKMQRFLNKDTKSEQSCVAQS